MIYNPAKLLFPALAFVIGLSLGGKSLWAMENERREYVSPWITEVNKIIELWEMSGEDVSFMETYYFPIIEKKLGAKDFNNQHKSQHICSFQKSPEGNESSGTGSGNSGYSGAIISYCKCSHVIKSFYKDKDKQIGIKELVHSLMAFRMHQNRDLHKELKMVSICDAVICQNPVALSFVMESAQGKDIHFFIEKMNESKGNVDTQGAENVIKACARYLGTFHVRYSNHGKVEEGQGTSYLGHVTKEFYHDLCQKRIQSFQGKKGKELFKLEIGKACKEHLTSANIIQNLGEDQSNLINLIETTQRLFEKCSEDVYRSLNPCDEGTKRLYWTTVVHGDAHRRNFFYNPDGTTAPDSLERVTMIDYSSIMKTWDNIEVGS